MSKKYERRWYTKEDIAQSPKYNSAVNVYSGTTLLLGKYLLTTTLKCPDILIQVMYSYTFRVKFLQIITNILMDPWSCILTRFHCMWLTTGPKDSVCTYAVVMYIIVVCGLIRSSGWWLVADGLTH